MVVNVILIQIIAYFFTVEIRNKEMLKRNIRIIVRENLVLKAKMKKLESKVKDNTASEESYNMLFRIGRSF